MQSSRGLVIVLDLILRSLKMMVIIYICIKDKVVHIVKEYISVSFGKASWITSIEVSCLGFWPLALLMDIRKH
ncbi:hypothetical protein F4811DRAFT_519436 [Daldinia bambusicola]|nr:hypothetical protein F4811DRAFT_519436 [Daldinia bambusicola]